MPSEVKTMELNLTRKIEATPEEIYDVWLDPRSPGSPWHGVPKVILSQPQVDGLLYTMYRFEENEIAHYGRFVVLKRPANIQYTWVSRATQGMESLVNISIEGEGDRSLVTIRHTNLPDDEEGKRHLQAHGFVLGRMEGYFRKGGSK